MPRPQTALKDYLDSINPHSSATVEIYLKNGEFYFLTTTDFDLSIEGYPEPFKPGLQRVGEIEENLGRATSGVSLKIANEYEGDLHFWHKMDAADGNPLNDADVVVKVFRRDEEADWKHFSHDYYFTGKLSTTDSKEFHDVVKKDGVVISATLHRWIEMEIVLDTTAAGVCLATQTLSSANGFIGVEAADVSAIPTGGGIGGGTIGSGGASGGGSGGTIDDDCFIAKTGVRLASGEGVSYRELWKYRESFTGAKIKGFDDEGTIRTDFIDEIFRNVAYEYLDVRFANGAMFGVTERHRFWNELKHFVEIGKLQKSDSVKTHMTNWQLTNLISVELVKIPKGIEIFNLRAKIFNHYFVFDMENDSEDFAVHNRKRSPYDIGIIGISPFLI